LQQFVDTKPGAIVDQYGRTIGEHDGAIFYTIGQRHGLEVGGGLPYYVVGKNMKKNEVYVTNNLQDEKLWSNKVEFTGAHWINEEPKNNQELFARLRHRQKLMPVKKLTKVNNDNYITELDEDVRAVTPGQSIVFYSGNECLGGGIVTV
jgi:tRNA-specific 2-thiouridylase